MLRKLWTASLLALCLATLGQGESIKRLGFPSISPDGTKIAFSWQGDIWTVARSGGPATRLTVHPALDTRPHWFPDGSRIAFVSARFGSQNVFTMRPDGSDLKRISYEPGLQLVTSVSPDGALIYGYTNLWGRSDLFRVKSSGGPLVRLTNHPFERAFLPSISPDGKTVFYNRGGYAENSWIKPNMVSSALPEIWAADNTVPLTHHRRLTENETTDLMPIQTESGALIYISNADGWPNVWRSKADGSSRKALTSHVDGTCHDASVSKNGRYISYVFESDLYILDLQDGTDQKLEVTVPDDARNNPVQPITVSTGASEYVPSPDGKRAAIIVRGSLFLIPEKGGTTRALAAHAGRDANPIWLDAKTILYVSTDRSSKRELKTVSVDNQSKSFFSDPMLDINVPVISPDSKQIAFVKGEHELCVIPTTGGAPKTVFTANFSAALQQTQTFSWSPDSRWIVAWVPHERGSDLVLINLESGKTIVTAKLVRKPQSPDVLPKFLPNGRAVYFSSPEYSSEDLFIVDLVPEEPTFSEDDLDRIDLPKPANGPSKVQIYEPNLPQRLRRLTTKGASAGLSSIDSKLIWSNVDGQFSTVNLKTGAVSPVAEVSGLADNFLLNPTGSKLYVNSKGKWLAIGVKEPSVSTISFSAEISADSRVEQMALFNDIWWAIDRLYYDANHNGRDWAAIRTKYAKIVPYAFDRTDFYALMGEMMEELDSSHLGANAPLAEVPGVTPDVIGYLGVEFQPRPLDARGSYVVSTVLTNSPADNPASLLKEGDRILSVDGEEPGISVPISRLLNHKVDRHVVLKVDREGKTVTIDIKPISGATNSELIYQAWIQHERDLVEKLSQGQIAYLHIRAMDKPSLEKFLRESRTEGQDRKGLIIDCRFNGGGSTAVDVLGVLVRTPWLIRTFRGEPGLKMSENIMRSEGVEMPTALLVNTQSFSNAEIIAEGFRALHRGPIIGERTPGYVIGTGVYTLWDGGSVRMPSIGAYAINGENLENNGRRPDFSVWFDPNAWDLGRDLQIERAVKTLMK